MVKLTEVIKAIFFGLLISFIAFSILGFAFPAQQHFVSNWQIGSNYKVGNNYQVGGTYVSTPTLYSSIANMLQNWVDIIEEDEVIIPIFAVAIAVLILIIKPRQWIMKLKNGN